MKNKSLDYIDGLLQQYPVLANCKNDIILACKVLIESFKNGGKLLICGNGGSASDSEHIVAELMKGFLLKSQIPEELQNEIIHSFPKDSQYLIENLNMGLPAISLISQTSLITAFSNDSSYDLAFAQQVLVYGKPNDILLGISTSGNSKNIYYAMELAKLKGLKTIGLLGNEGGSLISLSDVKIIVPEKETYKIQEYHLPIYHCICMILEEEMFGK